MSGRPSFRFDHASVDRAELTGVALEARIRLYGIPEYALHDVERIAARDGGSPFVAGPAPLQCLRRLRPRPTETRVGHAS